MWDIWRRRPAAALFLPRTCSPAGAAIPNPERLTPDIARQGLHAVFPKVCRSRRRIYRLDPDGGPAQSQPPNRVTGIRDFSIIFLDSHGSPISEYSYFRYNCNALFLLALRYGCPVLTLFQPATIAYSRNSVWPSVFFEPIIARVAGFGLSVLRPLSPSQASAWLVRCQFASHL